MNTKARQLLIAAAAVLMIGGAGMLAALPVISVDSSISIAPSSIPVPETGYPNLIVGMNKVTIITNFSGQTASVDQVVVQLTSDPPGGFNEADIASIRVWYEPPGGNDLFDNGASIDDLDASSFGPTPTHTFSGGTATIDLNTAVTGIGASSKARLYVGVELKHTDTTSGVSIAVQVTSLRQTGKTAIPITPYTEQEKPLDTYQVALAATNIAPSEKKQGESAAVLQLVFDPDDPDDSAAILLESIKLHATGTPRSDLDLNSGGVVLYEDTNLNGSYDSGVDAQVASATLGAVTPAYATITPATAVLVPPAGKTFFIIVNISLSATINDVVKLQVDNPSTDISFGDAYADEVHDGNYAYVPAGRAYIQKGYLLGTSTVPSTNPEIKIIKQDIPQNPTVTSIVPGNNAANVDRTTKVVVIFSKPMVDSTINTTNITLSVGAIPVPCSVKLEADTVTATLTPSSILEWGTTYTATVKGDGSSGVQDSVDSMYLLSNKVWSFSTPPAIPPVVLATSPVNAAIEVPRDSTVTATFSKDMDVASVQSNFKLHDGTSYVSGTVSYDDPTRTATFTPDTLPFPTWGTKYTASIDTGAFDTDDLHLQSKYSWTFTTTTAIYPIVNSTVPDHGAIEVARDANLTVTFSKDMDQATMIEANFILFIDNNANNLYDAGDTQVAGAVSFDAVGKRVATFNPTPTLAWGTKYWMQVTTGVKDTDGLAMQNPKVWTFTTTTAIYPIVSNTSPAPGMENVPPSATVVATFSKDMKASTINDSNFILFIDNNDDNLYDAGTDTQVTGNVTFDGTRTATFTPSTALNTFVKYTATVTTGVQATDDLPLSTDMVWSFWTATQPVVTSITPADGATGVSRSAAISATFSKAMDENSIKSPATNFIVAVDVNKNHLYDAGDTPVSSTVSYDPATFTATFTPATQLAYASYVVTITTSVTDGSGMAMAAPKTWWFTTVPTLGEPLAANNMLVPGGNSQVTIFIPQPPGGANDRVTVQIFTTTGRRVATLVSGKPYGQISLPLLWNGTNGRGQKLGPGLYFIQIRATNYRRVLKVMIVR